MAVLITFKKYKSPKTKAFKHVTISMPSFTATREQVVGEDDGFKPGGNDLNGMVSIYDGIH